MLAQLDAALVRAGHVSVVACAGSSPAGTLVATPRIRADHRSVRRRAHAAHRGAIERALRRWPVDVVHMHGIDFHDYLPPAGPPVLVTLHLPLDWYPPDDSAEAPEYVPALRLGAQRARGPSEAKQLPVVPNGVARCARPAPCQAALCPGARAHLPRKRLPHRARRG